MAAGRAKRRTGARLTVGRGVRRAVTGPGRARQWRTALTLGLVALGPMLALATMLLLGPLDRGASSAALRVVVLADLAYVLVVAALVAHRVGGLIAARRRRSAGARLHLRLSALFALIALLPAILVAIFAGLTVNMGLEGWFSERVRTVIANSLAAAEAYEAEQRAALTEDAETVAGVLESRRRQTGAIGGGELRQLLGEAQQDIQRGLKEAFVIDAAGEIVARGERSYLFGLEAPDGEPFSTADAGGTALIEDWDNHELRALVSLDGFAGRYLYISRAVDGDLLGLLDQTQETARFYQQLETERGRLLFEFGLLYLGFALILVLAAVWLGLWFAERLSRPVGRLADAAQRVGEGDLDARVAPGRGEDEIATLGRAFNRMTRQLKDQREALMDTNRQIERRRRLFDSVLSSVTAGVIGLDGRDRVEFVNRSAAHLLDVGEDAALGRTLAQIAPEFSPLLDEMRRKRRASAQTQLGLERGGRDETLLLRIAARRGADGAREGHVLAFDDITDLVSAQRMAAWGDVARRIAHEIKNPLTPIQLSAERLRRKFRNISQEESEALEQLTGVIIRQSTDLRRIVDEFSRFARMPAPSRAPTDLAALARDAASLQEGVADDVIIRTDLPEGPVTASVDATMISQALTNLLKNAAEATESHRERAGADGYRPELRLSLTVESGQALIVVEDNGIGLPAERSRLLEPYVTTREKGTGLGLAIVRKIVEEHDGRLVLEDAPPFAAGAHRGARAVITLALAETPGLEAAQ